MNAHPRTPRVSRPARPTSALALEGALPSRAERRAVVERVVAEVRQAGETIRTQMLKVGDLVYAARFGRHEGRALGVDLDRDEFFREISGAIERLELGFTHERLTVLVRIAALNDRLESQYWRSLDEGRKELLLPLKRDSDRNAGAKFAFQMKPTHQVLRAWVRERLREGGTPVHERGVTLRAVNGTLDHLARVPGAKSIERLGRAVQELSAADRRVLRAKVRAGRVALEQLDALLAARD
jgi:hypothetical protein